MALYKVEGGYVASSRQAWIPGCYESERAARYAFRFPDWELQKLQDAAIGRGNGIITFADLQTLAATRRAKAR